MQLLGWGVHRQYSPPVIEKAKLPALYLPEDPEISYHGGTPANDP